MGFIGRVETANTDFTLAGGKVTTMQAELTILNYLKKQVQGGASSQGRIKTATVRNRDNDQLDGILEEIVEAQVQKNSLKAAEKKAKDSAGEVVASYEDWKNKCPRQTKPALMGHGKDIVLPVGRYYHNKFTNEYRD